MPEERALAFPCGEDWLYGVLSLPQQPNPRGVLVIVGGPQYRAGSHRQFTLLARSLAAGGTPVMRFDYRAILNPSPRISAPRSTRSLPSYRTCRRWCCGGCAMAPRPPRCTHRPIRACARWPC
jgi:hypothetical protein